MKKLVMVVGFLLIASTAFALTAQEEAFVTQLFTNRQKLIDLYNRTAELSALADNIGSETLPLQLANKREELRAVTESRDAEVDAIKVQAEADIQAMILSYQAQIDSLLADISQLLQQIDALY